MQKHNIYDILISVVTKKGGKIMGSNLSSKNYTIRLSKEQYHVFQEIAASKNTKVSKLLRHFIFSNPIYGLYYKEYLSNELKTKEDLNV